METDESEQGIEAVFNSINAIKNSNIEAYTATANIFRI